MRSGRIQHIAEAAVVYTALNADLWVVLDGLEEQGIFGAIFLALICVGVPMAMVRLLLPTRLRSFKFIRLACISIWATKLPLVFLIATFSTSGLKWISVLVNVCVP